jgi:outer membrane receptor protein involved in Fe transport
VRSTNPTVAVRYQPLRDIAMRASWGTGFVAPDVNQLSANLPATTSGFIDPRRGNSPLPSFQFQTGGNPDLRPEESESFSAGLILTPRFIPNLRLSLDYTRIEKTDNIAALDFQQVLDNEAFLPGRVTRGPNLPTDPAGWAGPVTFLDRTNANIARSKIEAYDLQLDYRIDLAERGSLELQLMATRLDNLETQLVPTAPVVQNAGVVPFPNSASLPLKLKANLGVTWTRERWTAGWLGNYFDSYLVANPALSSSAALFLSQGSRTVDSQMYHDLFASYRFGASFLQGTEVQLTVRNVLNEEPPLDVSNTLGLYSYLGDPRLASYSLSIRHAF